MGRPNPSSYFIYIFPHENTHLAPLVVTQNSVCISVTFRADIQHGLGSPQNESLPLCRGAKRWQWPQEERSVWQLPASSGCGGEAELGREEVCQELIEFVLPALTLGPVAYQATSPGALQTDLPLLGHLISPSPCLQMSTPSHTLPSTYTV